MERIPEDWRIKEGLAISERQRDAHPGLVDMEALYAEMNRNRHLGSIARTIIEEEAARERFSEPTAAERAIAHLRKETAEKEAQLLALRERLHADAMALHQTIGNAELVHQKNSELRQRVDQLLSEKRELETRMDLQYLLQRVIPSAAHALTRDSTLREKFESGFSCDAFVISIDVRRSTDLMLRGRTPGHYARFIDGLCRDLQDIVKRNFVVIDKFTGDGLLAYFPSFFSGVDGAYRALETADQCHRFFEQYYTQSRHLFSVISADAGLGIGIDFGQVQLLRITNELTVVGTPVVYACRLSAAPAGKTYINNLAFSELRERAITGKWPESFRSKEVTFSPKNEDPILCHDVSLIPARIELDEPVWVSALASSAPITAPEDGSKVKP